MSAPIITLCYRKIIDAKSTQTWEKLVWEDSFAELKMQAQYYNQEGKYTSFAELIHHEPAAERLHFLVSAAVVGYVGQLNKRIPDIVNILGKHFLTFKNFNFEIINSNFENINRHQIAINFFSPDLCWYDTIGNYLLIADAEQTGEVLQTQLLQIRPFLNINTLQK